MTGWWRRNTVPIVALIILAPLTAGVIGWNEGKEYFLYQPTVPVMPATEEGTVDLGGATWGPIRAQILEDTTGLTVPDGTKVVAAVIPVDWDGDPVPCSAPTLVEQSTDRQWSEMRTELGLKHNSDEPTSCDTSKTEPYELIMPYIVPEDAGPFWVKISPAKTAPEFVQFSIEP